MIAKRYELKKEDVAIWFEETVWAYNGKVETEIINQVQERLLSIEIIDEKMNFNALCSPFGREPKATKS